MTDVEKSLLLLAATIIDARLTRNNQEGILDRTRAKVLQARRKVTAPLPQTGPLTNAKPLSAA